MMSYSVGDLVISLCGHDKGELFIVLEADEVYVTVCDGKRRKAEKNKKKKNKHVMPTGQRTDLIKNAESFAVDAVVRREIKRLKEFL